jgi:hypothetical protein
MSRRITTRGPRRLYRGWAIGLAIIALVSPLMSVSGPVESAQAASGSDFDPGNIISDAKLHDSGSMSAAQIQAFLNSKVSSCTSGYTCLKDYRQSTQTIAANAQCSTYYGAANEAASTIIAKVGQACSINPQVLLVTLQKEQALVTSRAPSFAAYQRATGYACPDTAPCAASTLGFFNQVYKSAWQFVKYETDSFFSWYPVNKVTNIGYNPNAACGTRPVYIQNQATADLYYYTPYVPNAAALANLYGSGDGCSSYGNRNFWSYFSDWFGSPTGPKSLNGSFDTAFGIAGGIQIAGWSVDPYLDGSSYIWVNINGSGGPFKADKPLSWIQGLYPNSGPNHGFDEFLAKPPGAYQVCVYGTNSVLLGCKNVTVPASKNAAGALTTATGVVGGITVSGWSLDKTTSDSGYIWINVDGHGGPARANLESTAAAAAYPKLGSLHGYSTTVKASPGPRTVCVYGADSVLLGCKVVSVPPNGTGKIESVKGVVGGITVTGWSLDRTTSASTYIWVNVDGSGGPAKANLASSSAATAYPALGNLHGYSVTRPASPGVHEVCVYGTDSLELGCKSVTVPPNGAGSFDTATGTIGKITVSGWSLDQRTSTPGYVWINVNGEGGPYRANQPLNWIEGLYPGLGANHGFSATISRPVGTYDVCVYGTDSLYLGCKSVSVPSSGAGSFDTATGVQGGIAVSGWALDTLSPTPVYVWINVDGSGGPVKANKSLNWIDGLYHQGSDHGFAQTIPASSGKHEVCAFGLDSVSLGCKTVTVP